MHRQPHAERDGRRVHRWRAGVVLGVGLALVLGLAAAALFTRPGAQAAGVRQPAPIPCCPAATPGSSLVATPGPTSASRPAAQRSTPVTSRPTAAPIRAGVFFDDFAYAGPGDAAFRRTWSVRTAAGGPGQSGAAWSADAVSFSGSGSNAVMTLSASTGGTATGTTESEVDSQRVRFEEGTYAVRVRFTDAPSGLPGAHVTESPFLISDSGDRSPDYSELDFEYLPIGGWGDNRAQLDFTTWRSSTDSRADIRSGSLAGWHVLELAVGQGTVTYYVDGAAEFTTTGGYYPRAAMVLAFNVWFIDGELGGQGPTRSYTQQIDWAYVASGTILTPAAVQAQVNAHRAAGNTFADDLS